MRALLLAAMLIGAACGCSNQQAYSAGQGWQRNACNRLPDAAAQARCLERAEVPYDAYQRERAQSPAAQP